jgi:hypothetical protein
MWSRPCSSRFGLTLVMATCALCGCGKADIARVAGRVTLDGQPLSGAQIVFEDAARGVSVNAQLSADGQYTARTYDKEGLPPGTYQIAVRPGQFGTGEAPLADAVLTSQPVSSTIPERYRSAATSGLSVVVAAGDNPPQNFALTSP